MFESQFITYAQNGEDVLLWRALKHVEKGFYIDVGAQDSVEYSVTKAFYDRGWHGINVEPVRYWHDRLLHDRPHDINLRVAASDRPGTLELYEVVDTGLSTSDPEFAKRHAADGHAVHLFKVPSVTLDAICNDNQVDTVHFLKVDCEGAEGQVLEGFSFFKVRPWIVLVEATEPNSTEPTWQQWEHLLTRHAYQFVFFDGLNRYYIADEHKELAKAFDAPVNVFDSARPIATIEVEAEVRQLKRESDDLKGAEANGRLRAERDQVMVERDHVTAERDRVMAERDQATAERYRVTAERNQVTAERDRVAAERDQVTAERDQVTAERDQVMDERDDLSSRLLTSQREAATCHHAAAQLQQREAALLSSHSWHITGPLRACSRSGRSVYRRLCRAGYSVLRLLAHMARPALREFSKNDFAKKFATSVLGKHSRIIQRSRLFLFGAVPTAVIGADHCGLDEKTSSSLQLNSESASRDDGCAAIRSGPFHLDQVMERIRAELTTPCAASDDLGAPDGSEINPRGQSGVGGTFQPDFANRHGVEHAMTARDTPSSIDEVVRRVDVEVASRRKKL